MSSFVLIWGGGDLASGVALRLQRVGLRILVVETAKPMAVRRSVSFAQAVYDGEVTIEDVHAKLIAAPEAAMTCWSAGQVPVLVDPELALSLQLKPLVIVDARMRKAIEAMSLSLADLVVGLGPGCIVGKNCHCAVETNRGHFLGRVYWEGAPEEDTGVPGVVAGYAGERVLYSPCAGQVESFVEIGALVSASDLVMRVAGQEIRAPFAGIVRGLIQPGVWVEAETKIGDIDPRPEDFRCWSVSEKSLAIGGGVLEAILTKPEIRCLLWD